MFGDNTLTSSFLLFPEVPLEGFGLNSSTEHNPLNTQVLYTAWFELLAHTVEQIALFNSLYYSFK